MNIKDYLELKGYLLIHCKDDEYRCPCPICGGKDRFHLWTDDNNGGRWACRQGLGDHIGQSLRDGFVLGGDFLDLYMYLENVSFLEAKKALGLDSLPLNKTIYKTQAKQEKPYADDKAKNEIWIRQARKFVEEKAINLFNDKTKAWKGLDCLSWLQQERCLNIETIKRFKLGLITESEKQPLEVWGLEKGENDKLSFCPQNLVIPIWRRGGYIDKIKIRFPEENEKKQEKKQRFTTVKGSNDSPSVYNKPSNVYVLVESELDAILLAQECPNVCPISLSGAGKKPTESLAKEIMQADVLLLCLDSDDTGKANLPYWEKHFSNSFPWRISPKYGKDPAELEYNYRQGKCPMSLSRFIEYGIEKATAKEQPTEQKRELSQEEVEAITNKLDEVLSNAVKNADSMTKEQQDLLTSLLDQVDHLVNENKKNDLAVVLTKIESLYQTQRKGV